MFRVQRQALMTEFINNKQKRSVLSRVESNRISLKLDKFVFFKFVVLERRQPFGVLRF